MRRPRFIAEQARHAKGLLGRLIAAIMARETWGDNLRAIDALRIEPGDQILDIGCGHGRSLAELAKRVRVGRIAGVDPSALMVQIAAKRSQRFIKSRRVELAVATADKLPFPDAAFDKALCVHVLYFLSDLGAAFREIARVMRPGGSFVIAFRTTANEAAVRSFPSDVYKFRALEEVLAALQSAGFAVEEASSGDGSNEPIVICAYRIDRKRPLFP